MVMRLILSALVLLAGFSFTSRAEASGDYGCGYSWTLVHPDLDRCSNLAFLNPGNDTRTNLLMLAGDRHPGSFRYAPNKDDQGRILAGQALFDWSTFSNSMYQAGNENNAEFASGDGTRCRSNAGGILAFEKALRAAKSVPTSERFALIAARKASAKTCEGEVDSQATLATAATGVTSTEGLQFLTYLRGAFAFYDDQFAEAATHFATLNKAPSPWLKEAAHYMQGRVALNIAQVDAYDDWGYPKKEVNAAAKASLATAETQFLDYLRAYPKGQYAGSARGLLRRVYWLSGDQAKLLAEYEWQLAQPQFAGGNRDFAELADEIDQKLSPSIDLSTVKNVQLLTMFNLHRIRATASSYDGVKQLTVADLEAQRAKFASSPELFGFLQAAHAFYIAKNPKEVLRLIPDAAKQGSFTSEQFSRQMLRGMALEALKDKNARGFWLDMFGGAKQPYQRDTLELALAYHEERNGGLMRAFDKSSPIKDRVIREILLQHVAGPALLRQQAKDGSATAHERDVALFVLLFKQLTRGAYADFVNDTALIKAPANTDGYFYDLTSGGPMPLGLFTRGKTSSGYPCPSLKETAGKLAKASKDSAALLCLADFTRINGFDGVSFDEQPRDTELGGGKSMFPGGPFSRLELYKGIIADAATKPNDKAYALYRAINCYAPGGNNSCRGKEVEPSQRKAWFNQLKKNHPDTQWAKSLQYFW